MVKIWEVDFTKFSGTTVLDNIGSQNLNSTGLTTVSPLPGFTYRPGCSVSRNNTPQYANMYSPGASNSYFTGSWTTRSFVMWVYFPDLSAEGSTYIWGEGSSTSLPRDGFMRGSSAVYFKINDNIRYTYNIPSSSEWYCLVMTVNKTTPEARFYVDGTYLGNYTGTSYRSTTWTYGYVGQSDTGQESAFSVGQVSTYNHELQQSEIDVIQSSFLVDRTVPYPYQWVSGTVYGTDGSSTVSGSKVFAIAEYSGQIVSETTTSGNGQFLLDIPLEGDYTIVATSTPNSGAAAFPIIATSGTVYYP